MAVAHERLASLAVDLHEVGDLLALTNSFTARKTPTNGAPNMAINGASVVRH